MRSVQLWIALISILISASDVLSSEPATTWDTQLHPVAVVPVPAVPLNPSGSVTAEASHSEQSEYFHLFWIQSLPIRLGELLLVVFNGLLAIGTLDFGRQRRDSLRNQKQQQRRQWMPLGLLRDLMCLLKTSGICSKLRIMCPPKKNPSPPAAPRAPGQPQTPRPFLSTEPPETPPSPRPFPFPGNLDSSYPNSLGLLPILAFLLKPPRAPVPTPSSSPSPLPPLAPLDDTASILPSRV